MYFYVDWIYFQWIFYSQSIWELTRVKTRYNCINCKVHSYSNAYVMYFNLLHTQWLQNCNNKYFVSLFLLVYYFKNSLIACTRHYNAKDALGVKPRVVEVESWVESKLQIMSTYILSTLMKLYWLYWVCTNSYYSCCSDFEFNKLSNEQKKSKKYKNNIYMHRACTHILQIQIRSFGKS